MKVGSFVIATLILVLSSSFLSFLGAAPVSVKDATREYFSIFYGVMFKENTDYFNYEGQTITLTSQDGAVLRYIPELDSEIVVETFTSADWAKQSIWPYTVDNRLFLIKAETDFYPTRVEYWEINPTNGYEFRFAGDDNNVYESSAVNYAVVGNYVYYVPVRYADMFEGYIGGGLEAQPLMQSRGEGARQRTLLLPYGDPDNYGVLDSAGGRLFRILINKESQTIRINQISLNTGKIIKTQDLNLPNHNGKALTNWCVSEDKNAIYLAAQYNADTSKPTEIRLYRLSLTSFDNDDWWSDSSLGGPEDFWHAYTFTLSNAQDKLDSIDAYNNHVLIDLHKPAALLYDWTKNTYIDIQLPGNMNPVLGVVTVQLQTPTLTLHSSSTNVGSGQTVTLSGTIDPSASGLITISKKVDGSSWEVLTSTTLTSGAYSYQYRIPGAGTYMFQASFPGNSQLTDQLSKSIEVIATQNPSRCIIATATYGSEAAPQVQFLRGFRDNIAMQTFAGSSFMNVFLGWYYSWSPSVAYSIAPDEGAKAVMRVLLQPILDILQVATYTYYALSFNSEFAIFMVGIVVATLIGLVYIAPIATLGLFVSSRVKKNWNLPRMSSLKYLVTPWFVSIALIVVAEFTLLPVLMMAATTAFVLLTIAAVAGFFSLRINMILKGH